MAAVSTMAEHVHRYHGNAKNDPDPVTQKPVHGSCIHFTKRAASWSASLGCASATPVNYAAVQWRFRASRFVRGSIRAAPDSERGDDLAAFDGNCRDRAGNDIRDENMSTEIGRAHV